MDINNKYNIVTLFCGCGGLDYGFNQAGFNIVSSNDCWNVAIKTYNHNFDHQAICDDITNEDTKQQIIDEIGNTHIHCIIGGPPCQAYSISGIRNPMDKRGHLFKDYVEMVKRIKPDMIVMENVKGILSIQQEKDNLSENDIIKLKEYYKMFDEKSTLHKNKKILKNNYKDDKNNSTFKNKLNKLNNDIKIINKQIKIMKKNIQNLMELVTSKIVNKFAEIGYRVVFKTLNAANYGVPQKRERVIFIGTKFPEIDIEKNGHPKETHAVNPIDTSKGKWKTVKDAISYLENENNNNEINHIISNHSEKMRKKIKETAIGTSLYKSYGDSFHKCDPNKPSRTVKENHGGVFLHYSNSRCMTPRELAELQSFPKDFIFKGSKSDILKQIGNAVPVKLGKAIGDNIYNLLDNYYLINNL
tara:strand:+ start:263 stop:1507 length:1245 start_codon:yes stop_codon:yes gene_type:complete